MDEEGSVVAPPTLTKRMLLKQDDELDSHKGLPPIRRFKDSIHDYMPFGKTVCDVIDTPQFQRLRNIKQLGTSYYVWPGASHNRFEHCLGVAYLAQTLATHLKTSQPSLGITKRDVQCVTLAGLCHDLGHGPWSHVWDNLFIPTILPEKKWCHEDASRMMFDALLEENGLVLDEADALFIKALIMGDPRMCKKKEKPFLFHIVANKINGLDVDKFDYIARDSHAIGEKNNLSFSRLIASSRVINDEICYDIKDANQVFELYHTRMSLHKQIYSHKTARGIEYMIVDALRHAEPVMNIARRLEDPNKYLYLTDHIQTEIEASEDPRLEEARKILHRIRVRDLYKAVDFKVFPWHQKAKLQAIFTPESVVKAVKERYQTLAQAEKKVGLSKEPELAGEAERGTDSDSEDDLAKEVTLATELSSAHVIIDIVERHHGMKDENPLNFVKFYSKRHPHKGVRANEDDISNTMPRAFGELMLRVYTRDSKFFGIVQKGYRDVLELKKEDLFEDNSEEELEDRLDEIAEPVTPPAEAPSTPKLKPQQPRTMSRVPTRSLSRRMSGVLDGGMSMSPTGDNRFTGVPPGFNPRESPAKKGKKRERENELGTEKENVEDVADVFDLTLLDAAGVPFAFGGGSPSKKKVKL